MLSLGAFKLSLGQKTPHLSPSHVEVPKDLVLDKVEEEF